MAANNLTPYGFVNSAGGDRDYSGPPAVPYQTPPVFPSPGRFGTRGHFAMMRTNRDAIRETARKPGIMGASGSMTYYDIATPQLFMRPAVQRTQLASITNAAGGPVPEYGDIVQTVGGRR